jgi:hypothetical protein
VLVWRWAELPASKPVNPPIVEVQIFTFFTFFSFFFGNGSAEQPHTLMRAGWTPRRVPVLLVGLLEGELGDEPDEKEANSRQTNSSDPLPGGSTKPGAPFRPPRRKIAEIVGGRAPRPHPPAAPETDAPPSGDAVRICHTKS